MENIAFTMTYLALKMFGKQLYSNVGSAISELVANGLDANAASIYVAIDARNRNNATVEILDNGTGMSTEDLEHNYVKIGFNKRKFSANPSKMMGRKGIGKLAALYLSNKFTIITKTKDAQKASVWELDVSELQDDQQPNLRNVGDFNFEKLVCFDHWTTQSSGTLIYIENVDLKGFGSRGLESLERRFSTYFLENDKIFLNIITNESDVGRFTPIKKHIAYKNMVCIFTDDHSKFNEIKKSKYHVKYTNKIKEECIYEDYTEVSELEKVKEGFSIRGKQKFDGVEKEYVLSGWIGVHCTINENEAKENDKEYFKSTYYNPNQLRLYVRGKLAVANMLDYLGIARAFANYIEGEVSFDILDDDDLPDIATAGRQDFDSTDPRFELLVSLLKSIGNALVGKRQALADNIKKKKSDINLQISTNAKTNFAKNFSSTVENLKLPPEVKSNLVNATVNQIEGAVEAKAKYTIFISHASCDRFLSDFFYYYLTHLGFKGNLRNMDECEVFYSSSGMDTNTIEKLSDRIKNFLISANNDVLIIASQGYNDSQFCMFEGGAIWATKAVCDCKIVAIDYNKIPSFLVNGSPEVTFSSSNPSSFYLTREKYNDLIDVLQKVITHLNQNRSVKREAEAHIPEHVDFPDDVTLKRLGKKIEDYMDQDICEYWNTYVIDKMPRNIESENEKCTVQIK